jgi:molybdenum cofactor biosynthesis protein B
VSEPSPRHDAHPHRRQAAHAVPTAVITVSDTRTLATDTGGACAAELLAGAGHPVALREIVKDDADAIAALLRSALARDDVRAVVLTGGTGISPRDVTPEAVAPLLERELPGFGELFRALSYQEIGSAALLSRALGGVASGKLVFVLPGSRAGVRLALEKLVLPELGHLASEAAKGKPPQAARSEAQPGEGQGTDPAR